MKAFMDEDFLLQNETAKRLYHDWAEKMPIYDYHCHLSAKEIAENKKYRNITDLWLGGDHYKWRILRSNGIPEELITGEAEDKEKFMAWAKTMPYVMGNPLYSWSHLELKRYFGIDEPLSLKTAETVWNKCNEQLSSDAFRAKGLIARSNVKVLCTTDDPVDDLRFHDEIEKDRDFQVKVLPTFRPDKSFNIDRDTFLPWIAQMEEVVGYKILSLDALLRSLQERIDYFHEKGCRISDHSLEVVEYASPDQERAQEVFLKKMEGSSLSTEEVAIFKGTVLNFLGKAYAKKDWAMQLHIGALRNNNTRMFHDLGADSGFDSIHDGQIAQGLSRLLDDLDVVEALPKTILYVLNPRDNAVVGTMIGNFQGGGKPGKVQFGSAWWFCDHKDGMAEQMKALSNLGLLSRFIGMLTDSRSFLSYTRHEYFRRILCNLIGEWVENGEYPADFEILEEMVKGICFNNAAVYFDIEL